MPTYDYQCRSCGNVTEVIHSMLEPGPTQCERCGGVLRRVIYPAGIIFKGSGFYRNDSRGADTSGDGGSSTKGGSGKSGGEPAPAPAAADATSGASPSGDAGKKDQKKSDAPST